jgi:hypothetical protein
VQLCDGTQVALLGGRCGGRAVELSPQPRN